MEEPLFMSLRVSIIPLSMHQSLELLQMSYTSLDGLRILLNVCADDKDNKKQIKILTKWFKNIDIDKAKSVVVDLLTDRIIYTLSELRAEQANPASIWYAAPTGEING